MKITMSMMILSSIIDAVKEQLNDITSKLVCLFLEGYMQHMFIVPWHT